MKAYIVLALVSVCFGEQAIYYTSDQGIDIETLVVNVEQMRLFVDCIIEKTECPVEAAAIKREMPEALSTACEKCTDKQKHKAKIFVKSIETNFPAEYKELTKKFDPENKYFPAFNAAVDKF